MPSVPLRVVLSCVFVATSFQSILAHTQSQEQMSAATSVAAIRAMLRSDVPAEQAWGAWLAGQTQRKELVPELQSLAIPESPRNNLERFFVTNAALDALVQLKAGPDPAWSMRFFEQWPTETLVLLSGAGARADSHLLELVRTQKGYRWGRSEMTRILNDMNSTKLGAEITLSHRLRPLPFT